MVGERRDASLSGATPTIQKDSHKFRKNPSALSNEPENDQITNEGQLDKLSGKFPEEVSLIDGLKTVQLSDLKEAHKKPCVRDALLVGIGTGFGIGGVRAIIGARVPVICNWAAGTFILSSLVMHEYCRRWRTAEKQNMKRIVETVDRKRAERRLRKQEAKDESTTTR